MSNEEFEKTIKEYNEQKNEQLKSDTLNKFHKKIFHFTGVFCLGSNPGQADNIIRFAACCKYYSNSSIWQPKVSIDKTIQKTLFKILSD